MNSEENKNEYRCNFYGYNMSVWLFILLVIIIMWIIYFLYEYFTVGKKLSDLGASIYESPTSSIGLK